MELRAGLRLGSGTPGENEPSCHDGVRCEFAAEVGQEVRTGSAFEEELSLGLKLEVKLGLGISTHCYTVSCVALTKVRTYLKDNIPSL